MPQPSFLYVYPRVTLTVANGQSASGWVEINPPGDSRDCWAFCELITPATVDASRTIQVEYSDDGVNALATQNVTGNLAPITQTAAASIALQPTQYSVVHKYVRLKLSGTVAAQRVYQLTYRRV